RMIAKLHASGMFAPFGMGGNSDLHAPTNVVAWVVSGGLGLPDRDYYVKTEPRFVEARAKYLEHVAALFTLAGRKPDEAKAAAATVMKFETALAQHALDNVSLRDPKATDHKTAFAE